MISRPIVMALQAAVRRAVREGATPEQLAEWVNYALTGPVPRPGGSRDAVRGRPCPTCPGRVYKAKGSCSRCRQAKISEAANQRRQERLALRLAALASPRRRHGPDLAWREVVFYGAVTLKMTDAAMARELGVSRERIRQIRNKTGAPLGSAVTMAAG